MVDVKNKDRMQIIKEEYQSRYPNYETLVSEYKSKINDKGFASSRMESIIKGEIISMFSDGIEGYPYIKYPEDIAIKEGDVVLTFGKKKHVPHINRSFLELTEGIPEADHVKVMLEEYQSQNRKIAELSEAFSSKVDCIFEGMSGTLKKNIGSRVRFRNPVNENIFLILWSKPAGWDEVGHCMLYYYHVDNNIIPDRVWE